MSQLHKIFLPSPHTFFSVFSSSVREPEAGNRKLDDFPVLSPKCSGGVQPHETSQLLHRAATGLSGKSAFGSSLILTSYRAV